MLKKSEHNKFDKIAASEFYFRAALYFRAAGSDQLLSEYLVLSRQATTRLHLLSLAREML